MKSITSVLFVILALTVQVSFLFALAYANPFIVLALALDHGQGQFSFAVEKIHPERYQGETLFIYLAVKLFDFLFIQKEFADPQRGVVVVVGKGVDADVYLVDPHLAVGDLGVGVFEVSSSQAQGFNLRTFQHKTGFVGVLDEIVVPGFSILGYDFPVTFGH